MASSEIAPDQVQAAVRAVNSPLLTFFLVDVITRIPTCTLRWQNFHLEIWIKEGDPLTLAALTVSAEAKGLRVQINRGGYKITERDNV